MFDIGWQEMLVVGLVTLLIVGPKDLPKVIKTVRDGMKQVRGLAREFQSGMDDLVREADLEDTKKILKNVNSGSIEKSIRETVDPKGELEQDLQDLNDVASDVQYNKSTFMASSEPKKAAESPTNSDVTAVEPSKTKSAKKKAGTAAKRAAAKKPAAKKSAAKKTATKKTTKSATKSAKES